MKALSVLTLMAAGVALSGCVLPSHEENAALRMPRPLPPPAALAAFAPPDNDYPTVGGDILKRVPDEVSAAPMAGRR